MEISLYATNGMNLATGYGRMEAGLLRGMREAGLTVSDVLTEPAKQPVTDLAIVVGDPAWCRQYPPYERLWLFTMSESTRVSAEWVHTINRRYERVLVPCPGLVDIYRGSGVRVPVHFVPLGVDLTQFALVERDPAPKTFQWLTYSLGDMRKGAELVMMAFDRLFKGDMRHRLVIKCRDAAQWLRGLDHPQMEVIEGELSELEWLALMRDSQAFVFPSRGEGFGLPPREAVLTGLPVIATEWLGLWDVNEWGWTLPVAEMRPAQFDFWEANAEGALWAEPDKTALDKAMLHVFHNYPMALAYARRGRKHLLAHYSWQCVGEQIAALVRETKAVPA